MIFLGGRGSGKNFLVMCFQLSNKIFPPSVVQARMRHLYNLKGNSIFIRNRISKKSSKLVKLTHSAYIPLYVWINSSHCTCFASLRGNAISGLITSLLS